MDFLGETGVWLVTVGLLVVGLVGCIVPVLPGHLIMLIGVVAFRLMKGPEGGLQWWGVAILVGIAAVSQAFELVSGSLGSKWFGGSKWGAVGAILGGLVGMFFFPIGLLVGPLLGAYGLELAFAKKDNRTAMVSGVGSVVGTVTGMGFKIVAGIAMIVWFFADVFLIG